MTPDHWKDDVLPKFSELPIRHRQCRLQLVDCFVPPLLRHER
jgi:hypothetical protein